MKLLKILKNDELKKERAKEVFDFIEAEKISKDIFFTMKMAGGIGLAAPQVSVPLRIIAIDTTNIGGSWWGIMLNPSIIDQSDDTIEYIEGCLSFPDQKVKTKRSFRIKVEFQDIYGNKTIRSFSGIDAVCIQHEIDHLDGITMHERGKTE